MSRCPVILLAHGSRHPDSAAAITDLADAVSERLGVPARAAFLDFDQQTLSTTAADLAATGATDAIVVPLLFTHAFHHRVDVPAAIEDAHTAAPTLTLHLASPLGTDDDVADVLIAQLPEQVERLVLYSVGSSVPGADGAIADLARRLGRRLGIPSVAITATGADGGPGPALQAAAGGAILPLFVAPGVLWDLVIERVTDDVMLGRPLGAALMPVVCRRVHDACRRVCAPATHP